MFGDVGHGFLLILFALMLIANEKKFKEAGGFIASMTGARYALLLMGI